jgi:dihydroorotate dehydrogenase (NAD+) catalytic subunit
MAGRGEMTDLSIDLGFMKLKNPVLTASGTFGYGVEFTPFVDLNKLGGFVVKGLYFHPRPGNPPPRLVETASGLINAIGLQGVGVKRFSEEILPQLKNYDTALIVNVCGNEDEEYAAVVEYLDKQEGIAAYELNISCPNTKRDGRCPALNPDTTHAVVRLVKKTSKRPVFAKLSPNVTDITEIAMAAEEGGADGLALANTFLAMAIDVETRKPKLANVFGGLSGPAIKPLTLRIVYQVAQRVQIPIVGIGGIVSAKDALEYLIAGASAIEVGTANFVDPKSTEKIIHGLDVFCREHGIQSIQQIVGTLKV